MKLVSFVGESGDTFGVVHETGVVDVGRRMGGRYADLRAVLEAAALDQVAETAAGAGPDADLDEITFLPVVPTPGKIVCVGLNYDEHRIETGREPTGHPVLFPRFADCQIGHREAMVKPVNSDMLDYEGELAVIIGRPARHVGREAALGHVAGYACYNDGSVRDFQGHTHQFLPGKNFPATGAFGPWMVTADEIPDPSRLTLATRLNGEEMQRSGTDRMIFDVPYLISYISSFMTLRPGDVIVTGTPAGVGFRRDPPVFLKDGDLVEVEIDAIGVLSNPVVDE